MKKRRALKKFIAMVLTLAILTSSIPVASVFAATDNFLDECGNSLEEVEESIEDSKSVITAGDWRMDTIIVPQRFVMEDWEMIPYMEGQEMIPYMEKRELTRYMENQEMIF